VCNHHFYKPGPNPAIEGRCDLSLRWAQPYDTSGQDRCTVYFPPLQHCLQRSRTASIIPVELAWFLKEKEEAKIRSVNNSRSTTLQDLGVLEKLDENMTVELHVPHHSKRSLRKRLSRDHRLEYGDHRFQIRLPSRRYLCHKLRDFVTQEATIILVGAVILVSTTQQGDEAEDILHCRAK